MSKLLQPAVEKFDNSAMIERAEAALEMIKSDLPPEDYLDLMLRAFGDLSDECRAKEQYYRCKGQDDLAIRFDNARRSAVGVHAALLVAFNYERAELIRLQMEREAQDVANQT